MNKTKTIVTVVVLILIAGGWWYYAKNKVSPTPTPSGTNSPISTESIKIGSILILSGQGASWGEATKNGVDLAIKDINSNGGVNGQKLEAIHEDDSSDPKKAVSAFNKLVDQNKVKFIIGPNWSNTGLAVKSLAENRQVVMISPSLGVKEFNEGGKYTFNTWPHDFILSQHLAEYVYRNGYKKVALIGAKDVWVEDQTKAFESKFKELGGEVKLVYEPNLDTRDLRTEISKIKNNKDVQAIVMTTDGYDLTVLAARQIKELGIKLPLFNITVDNKIVADCGANCEGMIFPTFLTPTEAFATRYKSTYNREVEIGADSGYDAVMLLVQAIKATRSTDPVQIQSYLNNIANYTGVSGKLQADGEGGFVKDYLVKKVHNGLTTSISK